MKRTAETLPKSTVDLKIRFYSGSGNKLDRQRFLDLLDSLFGDKLERDLIKVHESSSGDEIYFTYRLKGQDDLDRALGLLSTMFLEIPAEVGYSVTSNRSAKVILAMAPRTSQLAKEKKQMKAPKYITFKGATYRLAADAPYEEIQKMLDGNQFLKGTKAGPDTVHPAGKYYLIADPAGMEHIRDRHVDESNVGSKFNPNMDPLKASIALMSKYEPEVEGGWKFKWIGKDTGQPVGVDNVKQGKPEDVAKMQDYHTSPTETIKIAQGKGEPTSAMSLIAGKVGELPDGKLVLSVMTAFPGKNGAHITNRNDLAKEGFYFVVPDVNKYKQASVTSAPAYITVKGVAYRLVNS